MSPLENTGPGVTEEAGASYHDTRNFRKERSNSYMDCNCNQRNTCTCRPQMPVPPCMNTNCGCGQTDIQPRSIRPMQQSAQASCQCQAPIKPMPCQVQPAVRPAPCQVQPVVRPMPCQCQDQTPIMPRPAVPSQNASVSPAFSTCVREDRLSGMPIAMGYVPWQKWKQTYSLEQGLNRGTIFPELDLPFVMGRCRG